MKSKSPDITLTSEELREAASKLLEKEIPIELFQDAEEHAREKIETLRAYQPDINYFNNDYLIKLTAEAVLDAAFSAYSIIETVAVPLRIRKRGRSIQCRLLSDS